MQLGRVLMVAYLACSGCDELDAHSLGALEQGADEAPASDGGYVPPPWLLPPRRRDDPPRRYDGGPDDGGPRDAAITMPCCTEWADFWDASIERCDELTCQTIGPPPPPRQGP